MEESQEKNNDKTEIKQKNPPHRFKKGESGNPNGRPKGSISLVTILKQRLELLGPDQKRSIAEHFIDNVLQDALDGKESAVKIVMNYVEGLPKQPIEHSGDPDLPFIINIQKDEGKSG